MKEPGLEAYVLAIEKHLSSFRGTEHVLSPRDFAMARAWHAAGVPLASVLAGIDQAFERDRSISSLQRCRRMIEALAASAPKPPARAEAAAPPEELLVRLEALQSAIANASRPAPFERPARRLKELLDLAAVAREPNWDYVRRKLVELDQLVDAAALEALPPDELESLRDEARRALPRQQAKHRPAAIEEAQLRYLMRRARERFALPRLAGG